MAPWKLSHTGDRRHQGYDTNKDLRKLHPKLAVTPRVGIAATTCRQFPASANRYARYGNFLRPRCPVGQQPLAT